MCGEKMIAWQPNCFLLGVGVEGEGLLEQSINHLKDCIIPTKWRFSLTNYYINWHNVGILSGLHQTFSASSSSSSILNIPILQERCISMQRPRLSSSTSSSRTSSSGLCQIVFIIISGWRIISMGMAYIVTQCYPSYTYSNTATFVHRTLVWSTFHDFNKSRKLQIGYVM